MSFSKGSGVPSGAIGIEEKRFLLLLSPLADEEVEEVTSLSSFSIVEL